MERWAAKVIGLFLTMILPFFFTMAPYWVSPWIVKRGRKGERFLCYLMCFGGGIFFGTFLLHMAPEVREILNGTLLEPNGITYPVGDLIIGCGFFFVLYLEKIVMRINKRKMERKERKLQRNCIMCQDGRVPCGKVCRNCREGKKCLGYENDGRTKDDDDNDDDGGGLVINSRMAGHVREIENSSSPKLVTMANSPDSAVVNPAVVDDGKAKEETEKKCGRSDSTSASCHDHGHDHGHDDGHAGHHNVRSLILIIALSLHHIFEGLALGLQTSVQRTFTLVIAILCHEVIISFSLGLQFVKSRFSLKRMIAATVCYCLVSPVGVTVGIIMSEVGSPSRELDLAGGLVQAFSCGTFIFVTFFEILQEEIDPHDTSIGKVTGAALGFVVMALLTLVPEEPKEEEATAEATTEFLYQNITTYSLLY